MEIRVRLGCGGPVVAFTRSRVWTAGFAVRRDWPDGTHDFFGLSPGLGRVARRLVRDERFWRRGPVRPVRRSLVWMRRDTFDLHRRCCSDWRCVGGVTAPAGAGGRR